MKLVSLTWSGSTAVASASKQQVAWNTAKFKVTCAEGDPRLWLVIDSTFFFSSPGKLRTGIVVDSHFCTFTHLVY